MCNDHGNVDWSVNCMFPKSLTVLNSRCAHKQSCSVLATTSMFGDPCPGTHKYLEAQYQCVSASQTSTTTNRPSPPWVLTNTPPLLANGSTLINPAALPSPGGSVPASPPRLPTLTGNGGIASSPSPPTLHTTLPGGRIKGGGSNNSATKNGGNRHEGLPPPPAIHHHSHNGGGHHQHEQSGVPGKDGKGNVLKVSTAATVAVNGPTTPPNTRILTGVGGTGSDDGTLLTSKGAQAASSANGGGGTTTAASASGTSGGTRTINNISLNAGLAGANGDEDETNMFCGPTNARNLFWNITRVGDVNVQPCPGGATGIAKWRCVLVKRQSDMDMDEFNEIGGGEAQVASPSPPTRQDCVNGSMHCPPETPTTLATKVNQQQQQHHRLRNFEPNWHPLTPDLTQCRSLWLNNLEVRVNQRDSSLISIANDLSEVTSSKTLYGGDMLVTTKIIQTMSEKMFHDKETFPDQRQREAIISELLLGVVKTGSNLLDETQQSSWLDLNQEDQMRVATSLLTGLEYNAFLLADTIIRERNVVQKVKNILLSVRVLEAKNIQNSEAFPDADQWHISDDRIELPRAALMENSEGGLVRIVFAAFDRLESILRPSYDHFDLKSARSYIRHTAILTNDTDATTQQQGEQQRLRILNSKVISASLGKGRHIQLSQPIKLVLRHLKTENVTNPTCVFWNYIDHAWSANGCTLASTNRTHSVCMCNHLTNFALLMDVVDEHSRSLFGMFDSNLRVLIYISITICLVFIVIALLTLKIFNGVFIKSARTTIYCNIYICLLFFEVIFLIGIEQSETSILCGFTTVFLHCAILSAIAWFFFEAFQSYSTLTTDDMLLEVDQTAKVNCYYFVSYGLSLSVVAISLIVNPSTYTQNDFCVLMDGNLLFYVSFVTPVVLLFVGALGYSFLSWVILCRKSRTALKNKESTRVAGVRFDIRCAFIFVLLLSAVWTTAYLYLRLAKMDEESAVVYGYFFVGFNVVMGLYIFVFHCIQNEKIRREYRKYVRQNTWLPKCLRCSKTSISSGIVGGNGSATMGNCSTAGGAASSGTLNSHEGGLVNTTSGQQLKKSKLTIGEPEETGGIISAADDAIVASLDYEPAVAPSGGVVPQSKRSIGTLKNSIMPGNLQVGSNVGGHIVLERGGGATSMTIGAGATGTLRSTAGSAGHTSPTSSAGSTHLIFGHGHKQQAATSGANSGLQGEPLYHHHPDHYQSWRQPPSNAVCGGGGLIAGVRGDFGISPQQPQEFFYWTQKHNAHGNKKKRGSAISNNGGADSPGGGSLHHNRGLPGSHMNLYPSYKKTTLKQQQQQQQLQGAYQQPYGHYAEALDPQTAAYYQQQRRIAQAQQQHQQMSSDDEPLDAGAAAHAHLLHLSNRRAAAAAAGPHIQLPPPPPAPMDFEFPSGVSTGAPPSQQRFFNRGKHPPSGQQQFPPPQQQQQQHSNCDQSAYDDRLGYGHHGEMYYNQGSTNGGGSLTDGPVYEEILSNRSSSIQHYDVGGLADNDDYEDDERVIARYESERRAGRRRAAAPASTATRQQQMRSQQNLNHSSRRKRHDSDDGDDGDDDDDDDNRRIVDGGVNVCDENDDDDEDDDDDSAEGLASAGHGLPTGDERMRRLMALEEEDFQRRFQRQQQQQQQQQMAFFGVSGGAGGSTAGSVRSHKKTNNNNAASPSHHHRLASGELFVGVGAGVGGHHPLHGTQGGPPLPPANKHQLQLQLKQHPHQQQQNRRQQQQISPQSIKSATSTSSHLNTHVLIQSQQQQLPQQPIGRNISAMLDENNTVRCYLEPLGK